MKVISEELKYKELEDYITSSEQSLIMVLHKAQELWSYLPKEVIIFVAKKLDISTAKVYGVVTFYSFFSTEKRGKYVIDICLGTACFVKGAEDILNEFKSLLDIEVGETTKDDMFTLQSIRCIGACGLAPVVSVNGKIYGHVTKKDVSKIIKEYKEAANETV